MMFKHLPILTILLLMFAFANAQMPVIKYYDSSWAETPKEKAFFYTEVVKKDTLYNCTSYWVSNHKLQGTATFSDSNFYRGVGTSYNYYPDGKTEDSTVFDQEGDIQNKYHFSDNGKLSYRAFYDKKAKEVKAENYDENGKKTGGLYTYRKVPKFPGGPSAWISYLVHNLKSGVAIKNGARVGMYTVMVEFIVDTNAKVQDVVAKNDPGYGTAEEAVRVVAKSPTWSPAIQNGKVANFRQRQSISFSVDTK